MEERAKFSALFSVYYKEKPEFFEKALESVYRQTAPADEWVIVKDGPIPAELQAVIDKYKAMPGICIKEVPLPENRGLGLALAAGVPECSFELIARMDSDDIAVPERFALQLAEFEKDPSLDLCGGQIEEFETTPDEIIGERHVPLTQEEIEAYQKTRTAFNHMTVMYRKSAVLAAGNYKNFPLMEDSILWVDMLLHGARCKNLGETLVYARTDRNMIARRGGMKYYKKYKNARKAIYRTGFITKREYRKTVRIQWIVCIMPAWLRKFVFFKMLHKKSGSGKKAE